MEEENQRIPRPPTMGMTAREVLERQGRPEPIYRSDDGRAYNTAQQARPGPRDIFTPDMAADRRNELIQVARNCVMLFDAAHVTGAEKCYVGRLCQQMLEFHS